MKYKYIILLISCSELDKTNPCILYFRVKNNTIDRDLLVTKKIIRKIYNIDL
jgi:hypothetical protein